MQILYSRKLHKLCYSCRSLIKAIKLTTLHHLLASYQTVMTIYAAPEPPRSRIMQLQHDMSETHFHKHEQAHVD